MSLIISGNLVLTDTQSGGGVINANNPLIGWRNAVTTGNASATTAEAANPASNLANPSTNLRWVGELSSPEADEYLTVLLDGADDLDYVGIARHNFATAQIAVSIEALDPVASPEDWEELTSPVIPSTDGPLLFRLPTSPYAALRVRLQPGNAAPFAAVLYVGALLVLQRRIYVGHVPVTMGVKTRVVNGRSESGDFLGRIVISEETGTRINMNNLTAAWVRTYLEPFLIHAREAPFFFAWRPSDYPAEVGFCWATNDPMPENALGNGMMKFGMDMQGVT